jgi:hypothetical protein
MTARRLLVIVFLSLAAEHHVVIVDKQVITGVSIKRGPFRVVSPKDVISLIEQLSVLGVDSRFEKEPLGLI